MSGTPLQASRYIKQTAAPNRHNKMAAPQINGSSKQQMLSTDCNSISVTQVIFTDYKVLYSFFRQKTIVKSSFLPLDKNFIYRHSRFQLTRTLSTNQSDLYSVIANSICHPSAHYHETSNFRLFINQSFVFRHKTSAYLSTLTAKPLSEQIKPFSLNNQLCPLVNQEYNTQKTAAYLFNQSFCS